MDEDEARLIGALTRDRQGIREKLTPEDRNQLDALLDLAAEGGDEGRQRAVARAVAAHLRAALPEEDVRAVERRFSGTPSPLPHVLLASFASFGDRSAGPYATGPSVSDGAEDQPSPYERLLAEPALSEDDLRDNFGVETIAPELIRLRRCDGTEGLPAFQFDGSGRPRDVVVAVNRLLGAAEDPWGVADWWLGPNPWLAAPPATLLGRGLDGQLLAAASVVGEED
ncbi:DUF3168 domain-containing protein [Streptomyces scabiei]|uniref:DUF3168 domain-containing protein n=1 Tax=Streptomyces scabiei TaxID=1930 RepID=UPI00298F3FA3|nr:DUF3168 domain-containing protein [Streptomyces scabiei]MDW8805819.1 DUF3168 domain-containing protein [Streptomyces scabiei]